MPYGPPLYSTFWGHIFCKYGGGGGQNCFWSRTCCCPLMCLDDCFFQCSQDCFSECLFCRPFGTPPEITSVANPPAPDSIRKCPEPQICPKFVPTIVFRGSNQGNPNLSKICRNLKNSGVRWALCPLCSNILFLTEAPLPDPTPTPPNTPKRTRNGPEQTRKGRRRTQNGPKSSSLGWDGRLVCRDGGGGSCKGKRKSPPL